MNLNKNLSSIMESRNDLKTQPHLKVSSGLQGQIKEMLLVPLILLVFASLCVFIVSSLAAHGPIKCGLGVGFVRIWLLPR